MSGCGALRPGESCSVRCREPYQGADGRAECPAGNVDPRRSLDVAWPTCAATCDTVPVGYARHASGWRCAPGFGGRAQAERRDCGAPLELTGCLPLMGCRAPEVDVCDLDLSDCMAVPAGGRCVVRCADGVREEDEAYGTCPEGNTDPERLLSFAPRSGT